MVRGVLDSTSTSSDFYTVFDNIVATNPQLNNTITEVRNETNLFLVKVLRFYPHRDVAFVQELGTKKKYYCHLTHEMLSYEVSINFMCDGVVETGDKYGTYVKPFSNIYGIVANVRFKGNTDEKCLLACLNYGDDNELKSNVRNGEIRIVSGDSSLSLDKERINLMTPQLFINGLPYDEPFLKNYYDKTEIGTIKSDTDAQIKELNDIVSQLDIEALTNLINEIQQTIEEIKGEIEHLDLSEYVKDDELETALSTKSDVGHNHDTSYSPLNHNHNGVYSLIGHNHDTSYSSIGHNHDDRYFTETEITNKLSNKVDKENGKGLSSNDYTTTEKNKLANIESEANKTIVDSSLSSSSTNPVQNKVIDSALSNKASLSHTHASYYTKDEIDGFLGIIGGQLPDYRNYVVTPSTYNANLNDNITVTVRITDLVGRPVPNEEFELVIKFRTIQEAHISAFSDANGYCTFSNVPMLEDGIVDFRCGTGHCQVNVTYDTGWVYGNGENGWMNSHWLDYSSANAIRVRRVGKVVHFEGTAKPNNSLTWTEDVIQIGTLPIQFRPNHSQRFVQQGSGLNKWVLSFDPNGRIGFARYGTTSNITMPVDSWMNMYATWLVE